MKELANGKVKLRYEKEMPEAGRGINFDPGKLLPLLRRDEWLVLSREDSIRVCGVKDLTMTLRKAVRSGKILKQKIVFSKRKQDCWVKLY